MCFEIEEFSFEDKRAKRTWLLADTSKGAVANVVLYTLVDSTRANQLAVYEYLNIS